MNKITGIQSANKDVLFIIAAYNEGSVIKKVAEEILDYEYSVLIVDDCSSDNTYDEALESGAHVAKHLINLGQGAALQTGIEYGVENNYQIMVTFDADGQHRVEDAILMIEAIRRGDADIVCGSRFLGEASVNMSIAKLLLLKLAVLFTKITTGVKVTDAHNGLRAFSLAMAKKIKLKQNRMAHASEFVNYLKGSRFIEMPVRVIYTDYSIAKGQRMSNSINILIDLFLGRF